MQDPMKKALLSRVDLVAKFFRSYCEHQFNSQYHKLSGNQPSLEWKSLFSIQHIHSTCTMVTLYNIPQLCTHTLLPYSCSISYILYTHTYTEHAYLHPPHTHNTRSYVHTPATYPHHHIQHVHLHTFNYYPVYSLKS